MAVYRIPILFALVTTCYSLNSWEIPDGNLQDHVTPDLDVDWFFFKKNYNRTYSDRNEDLIRRLIWEDNIRFIANHNRKYERGESTFSLGENHFADLAEDEFTKLYLSGLVIPDDNKHQNYTTDDEVDVSDVGAPTQIDWRAKGAVTAVRNQGSCGSCWAFAAIGAMESAYLKNFRQRKDLSEQQLVDCANSRWGNYGCRGGWMANAYKYIESFGGIANENCYRYTQRDGYCRASKRCIGGRLSTHRAVSRSESALKKAVADHGPVAIAADVSGRTFGFYRSGVFNNPGCSQRPNHAMVAVGYGRYYGRDYWLIKNSWGVGWGDQGYIKMSRNAGNQCAIASYAVYPVVK